MVAKRAAAARICVQRMATAVYLNILEKNYEGTWENRGTLYTVSSSYDELQR